MVLRYEESGVELGRDTYVSPESGLKNCRVGDHVEVRGRVDIVGLKYSKHTINHSLIWPDNRTERLSIGPEDEVMSWSPTPELQPFIDRAYTLVVQKDMVILFADGRVITGTYSGAGKCAVLGGEVGCLSPEGQKALELHVEFHLENQYMNYVNPHDDWIGGRVHNSATVCPESTIGSSCRVHAHARVLRSKLRDGTVMSANTKVRDSYLEGVRLNSGSVHYCRLSGAITVDSVYSIGRLEAININSSAPLLLKSVDSYFAGKIGYFKFIIYRTTDNTMMLKFGCESRMLNEWAGDHLRIAEHHLLEDEDIAVYSRATRALVGMARQLNLPLWGRGAY
jgi:hypothetical protein